MKIAPINNNYSNYGNHNCNAGKNQSFKGLWGPLNIEEFNNGWSWAYEADLIGRNLRITYYPFADESEADIGKIVSRKSAELNDGVGDTGYVSVVPLLITAKEYAEQIKKVKETVVKKAEEAFNAAQIAKVAKKL